MKPDPTSNDEGAVGGVVIRLGSNAVTVVVEVLLQVVNDESVLL